MPRSPLILPGAVASNAGVPMFLRAAGSKPLYRTRFNYEDSTLLLTADPRWAAGWTTNSAKIVSNGVTSQYNTGFSTCCWKPSTAFGIRDIEVRIWFESRYRTTGNGNYAGIVVRDPANGQGTHYRFYYDEYTGDYLLRRFNVGSGVTLATVGSSKVPAYVEHELRMVIKGHTIRCYALGRPKPIIEVENSVLTSAWYAGFIVRGVTAGDSTKMAVKEFAMYRV